MGHLIRCHTIHTAFKSLDIDSSFFLESDMDFSYKFSDISYFKWDEFTLDDSYDVIFIDSYEADIDVYNFISRSCKLAVYVDDFKRLPYPKGVILNFSPDADTLLYKHKEKIHTYLLGLAYIPIRNEFSALSPTKKNQLFIMLGGNDTANLSVSICEYLQDLSFKKVVVTNNQNDAALLRGFKNTKVLFKSTDQELIVEMANSSVAVTTASMTLYELAYLQIPTVTIAVSENQEIGALALLKHKIVSKHVSIKASGWLSDLKTGIENIQSVQSKSIIDARGTQRIINKIMELAH